MDQLTGPDGPSVPSAGGRRERSGRAVVVVIVVVGLLLGAGAVAAIEALAPPPSRPVLGPGHRLLPGAALRVVGGYSLTMESSGDLVARHNDQVIWHNGVRSPGARLVLEHSGELVEYSPSSHPVWSVASTGEHSCLLPSITMGTQVVPFPGSGAFGTQPLWTLTRCYYGNLAGHRVGVVGDSITLDAQDHIAAALQGSYAFLISGMLGFRTVGQLPAVQGMMANPRGAPADFVINLGTNDALNGDSDWMGAYSQMLDLIGRRCTLVVTVNTRMGDRQVASRAREINRFLVQQAASRSWVHLVDWNAALDIGDHRSLWLSDRVHPTSQGAQALAHLYLSALQRDC